MTQPKPAPQHDLCEVSMRRLDATLEAIAHAVVVASETTAADALEYLADYMNRCDAVEPEDVRAFNRWVERGRP